MLITIQHFYGGSSLGILIISFNAEFKGSWILQSYSGPLIQGLEGPFRPEMNLIEKSSLFIGPVGDMGIRLPLESILKEFPKISNRKGPLFGLA